MAESTKTNWIQIIELFIMLWPLIKEILDSIDDEETKERIEKNIQKAFAQVLVDSFK